MRRLVVAAAILQAVLLGWTRVDAATYYVARNAPGASDEKAGGREKPWKTLTHAAATSRDGDTVYVRSGSYRETLELKQDGVSFLAFGDDDVRNRAKIS